MLNLIAVALKAKRLTYHRIDGSSSLPQRKNAIEAFNSDPACNIMLASIGAAGEGYATHFPKLSFGDNSS